jgi:hypothetical protein
MAVTKVKDTWKSFAAYTYLMICLFDFLIMPAYTTHLNNQFITETISILEPHTRDYAINIIDRISPKEWKSLTTGSTGGVAFHICFALILGGSALGGRTFSFGASGVSITTHNQESQK